MTVVLVVVVVGPLGNESRRSGGRTGVGRGLPHPTEHRQDPRPPTGGRAGRTRGTDHTDSSQVDHVRAVGGTVDRHRGTTYRHLDVGGTGGGARKTSTHKPPTKRMEGYKPTGRTLGLEWNSLYVLITNLFFFSDRTPISKAGKGR